MFSPIQQARYIRCIDVSISKFQKTCLCKFSACVMFLDVSCTILWRCKLKSPQNGNLKKSIIHLSRNIIHMTYTTFIFVKVFWIRTNTVNVRGKNSFNMNEPSGLINIGVNYCALKWIAWKERVRLEVNKGILCVTFSLFTIQGLLIVLPYCLARAKTSEEL